jgi:hypothetical protein
VVVRAPPGEFVTSAPDSWTSARRIPLEWEVPLAGAGQISYSVLVDDDEVAEGITTNEYTLTRGELTGGVHTVQVQATDALGQVVDSVPATVKVDRIPPRARVRTRRGKVTVQVSDGPKGQGSGVKAASVQVSFGDGSSAHGHTSFKHSYAHAGTYTIVVKAADKVGNRTSFRRKVRVS